MSAPDQMDKASNSPDFVKKLFTMLEEQEYEHIVRWNALGDSFIVLDTNEFTKTILPRHFKHSNFASFVRQLNKYDFHKVRQTDTNGEAPYGEGAWEFKHENFQIGNKDSLDNIKRKAPVGKRTQGSAKDSGSTGYPDESAYMPQHLQGLQNQIDELHKQQAGMNHHLHTLTKNYQTVISEMLSFQRNMVAQDQLMQNLISYMMQGQGVRPPGPEVGAPDHPRNQEQAQKLINDYTEVAKASYEQMDAMNRRASDMGLTLDAPQNSWPQYEQGPPMQQQQQQGHIVHPSQQQQRHQHHPYEQQGNPMHGRQAYNPYSEPMQHQQQQQAPRSNPGYDASPSAPPAGQLYQNYPHSNVTSAPSHGDPRGPAPGYPSAQQQQQAQQQAQQQQQMQQQQQQQQQPPQASPQVKQGPASAQMQQSGSLNKSSDQNESSRLPGSGIPNNAAGQAVNAIRAVQQIKQTFVPWAVPPKVLLVEDDAVCRRLSSKFLSIFGCDIDMAVDGVSAVNKMNHTKYDLVLMDIAMPNLDGVSATSLIRQFDPLTPIISMTSNVQSGDVMTYFSHGMNDILPKPFTKDGLLGMLEKHLIHLKTLKEMNTASETGGPSEKDVAAGSAFNLSEADYLGMLSGLMGGSVPTLRRSAEEMTASGTSEGRQGDGQAPGKKARVEEVAQ